MYNLLHGAKVTSRDQLAIWADDLDRRNPTLTRMQKVTLLVTVVAIGIFAILHLCNVGGLSSYLNKFLDMKGLGQIRMSALVYGLSIGAVALQVVVAAARAWGRTHVAKALATEAEKQEGNIFERLAAIRVIAQAKERIKQRGRHQQELSAVREELAGAQQELGPLTAELKAAVEAKNWNQKLLENAFQDRNDAESKLKRYKESDSQLWEATNKERKESEQRTQDATQKLEIAIGALEEQKAKDEATIQSLQEQLRDTTSAILHMELRLLHLNSAAIPSRSPSLTPREHRFEGELQKAKELDTDQSTVFARIIGSASNQGLSPRFGASDCNPTNLMSLERIDRRQAIESSCKDPSQPLILESNSSIRESIASPSSQAVQPPALVDPLNNHAFTAAITLS